MSVSSAFFSCFTRSALLSAPSSTDGGEEVFSFAAKRSAFATSFRVVLVIAWEHSAILTSIPEILAFADEMASLIWSSFACSSARCAFSLATCSRWSTPSCTARSMAFSSAEICKSSAEMRPSDAVFSDR